MLPVYRRGDFLQAMPANQEIRKPLGRGGLLLGVTARWALWGARFGSVPWALPRAVEFGPFGAVCRSAVRPYAPRGRSRPVGPCGARFGSVPWALPRAVEFGPFGAGLYDTVRPFAEAGHGPLGLMRPPSVFAAGAKGKGLRVSLRFTRKPARQNRETCQMRDRCID